MVQMGIVSARQIFYEWLNYKKLSLAFSPHHLAICVICKGFAIFANLCVFTILVKTRKTRKMIFFTHLQNSENSKKFSYTWFISPRIIYCLVPRQPPHLVGDGLPMGDPSRKVSLFVTWRFSLNLDCVHLYVHTIFHKFIFYKKIIFFIKFIL